MQSGAVWLWRERRGAALGRCRNGGAQPRASAARRRRGAAPRAGTLQGPGRGRGTDWRREPGRRPGGGAAAADEVRGSRPEGGWACGPEFAHCWGLPRNKGKIDYPRRKRI